MSNKLVNPLYYPLAVLAGGVALVLGVRVAQMPSLVMLPVAALIATAGASLLKSQQPQMLLNNPELERELQLVRQRARELVDRANALRSEASQLLTDAYQLELLAAVQYACDLTSELPAKIEQLARRLQGANTLLSVSDLQQQLTEVGTKLQSSSGIAREQLTKLSEILQRNIQLAQQGQNARQAQVVSLSMLILEEAGVLQELQNKLRTSNLTDTNQAIELRSLSEEIRSFTENVDFLVSK